MKSSSIELIRFEGVVVAVGDNALLVKPDGGRYPLHVGDILRPGDLVFTGEQPLLLDFGDERSAVSVAADCVTCIDEQQGSMLAAASEQLDVAALQQAILAGVDPTAAFEAAAAGNAGGAGGAGSGGNSFVVIARDGASTQVEFGADTDPAAAATFTPVDEPAATLADDDGTPVPPVNNAPQTADVSLTTAEDTAVSGAVTGADLDGDALSFVLGTGPANGAVLLNPDGTFAYTPNANYNGSDSFVVAVSDGNGGTVNSTVTIGVTPVNDAPLAVNDAFTTAEDSALVLTPAQLLANDSDSDGDSLSISSVQGAVNGSVALVNGNVVFTPNADYHGPASFTYSISDGKGGTATASVSLTVTPVNDLPVIDPESANVDPQTGNYQLTTPEETPVSGAVVATDVDGDSLSYTLGTGPANGSVVLNPDGTFTYTPDADYNGSDSFTVSVSDGNGGTTSSTVTIGVTPVNDAPLAVNDAFTTAEDSVLVLNSAQLLANDSDVDGDSLSITSVQGAVNGSVALVNGNIVFTPNADYHGPASFTYSISDGQGGAATASVNLTITPVNDAPVIDPNSSNVDPQTGNYQLSTPEETPVSGAVVATDVDGDSLNYTLGTGPANGSVVLNPDGSFTYTPNANYNGSDSFTVSVSDGNGGTTSSTVTIGVTPDNDAPVAVNDAFTTAEDSALVLTPAQLLANDSDVDGDSLSISSVQGAVNGSVALVNGNIVFTPNADYHGPASFTYSISDGQGGTATASVSLTVTPVNDAPLIDPESANVDPQTGNYQLNTPEETPVSGAVVATDADGDSLSYSLATGPANGALLLNPDGTFTYTPNADYNGSDSFVVTVSDGKGGTVSSTVTIGVTPVNDAPVAVNDAFTTAEDSALVLTPAQLLANDSDVDGDSLSITAVQDAVNGSVALVNGNVVFTPNADYHGPASFTYSISDGKGGTATASVSLTVTPVNDAPLIDPESANVDPQTGNYQLSTPEETPVSGAVVATDADGDSLSYSLATGPANGALLLNPDGTFTYTPNSNYTGSDSFVVAVSDGNGGTTSSTVTIGVTPDNDAPVAVNDAFTTAEDSALVLTPAQLLANDSDVDGDSLSISSVQGAVNGSVALVNGNIVFTPNADYHGPASFTYSISDGQGGTATASVSLTVTEANEVPVAVANGFGLKLDGEFYSYQQSGSKVPNLTSLAQVEAIIASRAAPDARFVATNVDYGLVTYRDYLGKSGLAAPNKLQEFLKDDAASLSSDPVDGSDAIIRLTGSLDLKPGTYQFRVTADDGFSIRLDGQVVAEVPVNQSPTTTEFAEFTVTEGGTLPLEIIYWDQGIHAQLKVELRPAGGQYQLLAADDDFIITEGNPLVIDQQLLLANDSDADGDSLSIVAVSNGQYGTVLFDGDQLIYQASGNVPAGTSREDSFSYTISDGKGGTSVASVKVLVVGAVGTPAADSVPDVVGDGGDNLMFAAAAPLAGTSGVAMDGAGGNDQLTAGSGNDLLHGGAGDDQLTGGSNGSLASEGYLGDLLSGGSGADLFIWHQGDDQQQGGGVAHDYVSDFSLADGDRLDLSDLLQGETVATIDQFLSVSFAADETVLQLAPQGDGSVSQQIHLQGWSQQDWQTAYGDASLDAGNLVQKLVDEGKLVIGS